MVNGWRYKRVVPVMFLGGPLDYTTREVPGSASIPGRPAYVYYWAKSELGRRYRLLEVQVASKRPWWVYVLEGHAPTYQNIMDTCPDPN